MTMAHVLCAGWMVLGQVEPPTQTTVLVLPLEARSPVPPELAETLTQVLVNQVAAASGSRVIGYREVQETLSQEQLRQVTGCSSTNCAAEIAGALNAQELVMGSRGRVGQTHVLSLSRVRSRDAWVLARVMVEVPVKDEAALLQRMPGVAAQLFASKDSLALPAVQAAPSNRPSLLARAAPWAARAGMVAGVMLGAATLLALLVTGLAALGVGVDAAAARWGAPAGRHLFPQPVLLGLFLAMAAAGGTSALTATGTAVGAAAWLAVQAAQGPQED